MLSVYTRHAADCAKAKDKDWRRCRCPKWISGTHDGTLIRKSAKTGAGKKLSNIVGSWKEPPAQHLFRVTNTSASLTAL